MGKINLQVTTCIVTRRSSTMTSLVRKSAPIVALYWFENLRLTYWFISDVLPTPESPRMMTFNKIFLLEAIAGFFSLFLYGKMNGLVKIST